MMRAPLAAPSLLLVALLTGCAELLPSQDTAGLPEYAAPATSAPPSPKAVDGEQVGAAKLSASGEAAALVRSVSLQDDDVRSGDRQVDSEDGGDAVDDEHATLSGVCGKVLPSDTHRVARRRVQVVSAGGSADTLAGEVVVYESATWARRALAEWRDAIAECDLGEDVDVLGVPVRYVSAAERRDGRLPVGDNSVTTSVTTSVTGGDRTTAYQLLQRRGAVLSIVVLATGKKASAAAKAEALRLAKVVGRRQAELRG